MTEILPIPQWYGGIKFRSTLEARWAVFFDAAEIRWGYEPEGYVVSGRPYRPDFLLRDCGTWIEVKGDPARLDLELLGNAAVELPRPVPKCEAGPPLMILGNFPRPQPEGQGDWGFPGLHKAFPEPLPGEPVLEFAYYGFGTYSKNMRPWWLYGLGPLDDNTGDTSKTLLEPWFCEWDTGIPGAYAIARAHRFGRR